MGFKVKLKKVIECCAITFFALWIITPVAAQEHVIDVGAIRTLAISLHLVELFLAIFISSPC